MTHRKYKLRKGQKRGGRGRKREVKMRDRKGGKEREGREMEVRCRSEGKGRREGGKGGKGMQAKGLV